MSMRKGKYWTISDSPTRRSMRANRSKGTLLEMRVRSLLWTSGIRGYRLHRNDLAGTPDIAWIGKRVAVFVHGCFWHRCPACEIRGRVGVPKTRSEFWARKFDENQTRHEKAVKSLEVLGWLVITIWECEVRRNPERVVSGIREALDSRLD